LSAKLGSDQQAKTDGSDEGSLTCWR